MYVNPPITTDKVLNAYLDGVKGGAYSTVGQYDAPRSSTALVQHTDLLELLKHSQQLYRGAEVLRSALEASGEKDEEVQKALAAVDDTAATLDSVLIQALRWDPLLTEPSLESAVKAQQVFNIPELAEMILLQLNPRDLLSAAQINKATAAVVASSPRVHLQLNLQPIGHAHWRSIFDDKCLQYHPFSTKDDHPGLVLCGVGNRLGPYKNRMMKVHARFTDWHFHCDGGSRWPSIGSRSRRMLICEPVVKEMRVVASCCKHFNKPFSPLIVRAEQGLTVGDLLDGAKQVEQAHRLCPLASSSRHDSRSGLVNAKISFEGAIELQEDDPRYVSEEKDRKNVVQGTRYWIDDDEDDDEYYDPPPRDPGFDPYCEAKLEAYEKGVAIPTLAEYRTMNGIEEEEGDEEDGEEGLEADDEEDGEEGLEADDVDDGDVEGSSGPLSKETAPLNHQQQAVGNIASYDETDIM